MPVKLLLELSLECESLARAEALSAAVALGGKPKIVGEDDGVLLLETAADPTRLARRRGDPAHRGERVCFCPAQESAYGGRGV